MSKGKIWFVFSKWDHNNFAMYIKFWLNTTTTRTISECCNHKCNLWMLNTTFPRWSKKLHGYIPSCYKNSTKHFPLQLQSVMLSITTRHESFQQWSCILRNSDNHLWLLRPNMYSSCAAMYWSTYTVRAEFKLFILASASSACAIWLSRKQMMITDFMYNLTGICVL